MHNAAVVLLVPSADTFHCAPSCRPPPITHQEYIHRDLKLDNVIFDMDSMTVSVIDLGCAAPFYTCNFCGTPGCVPPNVYDWVIQDKAVVAVKDQRGYEALSKLYDSKYDAWCLGWLLLRWLFDVVPKKLADPDDEDAVRSFDKADLEAFLTPSDILRGDPVRVDFLQKSLDPDTDTSWSVPQLMEHPYLCDLLPKVCDPADSLASLQQPSQLFRQAGL